MVRVSSFSTVRAEDKCVESALLPPCVERRHVGKHEVDPVAVRRVLFSIPLLGDWELAVQSPLGLALIVNAVKTNHALQEDVQLRMAVRILRDFEQGLEDIANDVFKAPYLTA